LTSITLKVVDVESGRRKGSLETGKKLILKYTQRLGIEAGIDKRHKRERREEKDLSHNKDGNILQEKIAANMGKKDRRPKKKKKKNQKWSIALTNKKGLKQYKLPRVRQDQLHIFLKKKEARKMVTLSR